MSIYVTASAASGMVRKSPRLQHNLRGSSDGKSAQCRHRRPHGQFPRHHRSRRVCPVRDQHAGVQ